MINRFAIIVGAMKCGTTSLFSHLAQHPQICRSRLKEPSYFARNYSRGSAWYRGLWQWRPQVYAWGLEASTDYTKHLRYPEVVDRIEKLGGEFRFIYIMRNPLERIESHVRHQLLAKHHRATPAGVEEMLDISSYASQIAPYVERFGAEHVLLLPFEQLRDDPAALLRHVCEFLRIDPDFAFKGLDVRYNQGKRDSLIVRLLERSRAAVGLARHVPDRYKQGVRDRLSRDVGESSALNPEQRDHARAVLRDEVRRLETDFGFDASWWHLDDES
jgi:hypothetical protein